MAAVSGKVATVSYGDAGNVNTVGSWNLSISPDVHDVTSFSTSGVTWKSKIAGLVEGSGTVSGFWEVTTGSGQEEMQTNILTPSTGTISLEVDQDAGGKYTGDVVLSGMSIDVSIDGVANISYDFETNGALTFSSAT
jgi:predicted secreted protein